MVYITELFEICNLTVVLENLQGQIGVLSMVLNLNACWSECWKGSEITEARDPPM